jgi:hypothetical protein
MCYHDQHDICYTEPLLPVREGGQNQDCTLTSSAYVTGVLHFLVEVGVVRLVAEIVASSSPIIIIIQKIN